MLGINDKHCLFDAACHDAKTPLTSAMLYLSMLEDGVTGALNDEQKELVGLTTLSCREMLRHVEALTDGARLASGTLQLSVEEASIGHVVCQALEFIAPDADHHGVSLDVDLAPDLPTVPVDVVRLGQVLANLTNRLVKVTRDGGHIRLTTRRSNPAHPGRPSASCSGEVLIEVSTGTVRAEPSTCGLPRLIERLYRDDTSNESAAAVGLDLVLAKEIVDRHRGRIHALANHGAGLTLTITLPMGSAAGNQGS